MRKILLINNYNYRRGGADVVYLEQTRLLKDRGWRVSQLSMQHPKNDPSEFARFFTENIEFGDEQDFLRKFIHAGKIVYSIEAMRKVKKLIAIERPEIIHAHNVYHHLSPSVLRAATECSIPVVLTTHDLKLLCPAYSMFSHGKICEECKVYGRCAVVKNKCMKNSSLLSLLVFIESSIHSIFKIYQRNIHHLISPSKFFIQKFAEWGWKGPPIAHISNFVDVNNMEPNYSPGAYYLYFGRLSNEKGLRTLVDATAKAGVKLLMVGTGPEEPTLRKQVNQTGADVTFKGFKTGYELWVLLKGSRAVVLPSEWYENAPLTVIEAYAFGKPVIGADIGGIPELIIAGKTGALFQSGNSDELAKVLLEYELKTVSEIEAQGRTAREIAETEFTPDSHVSKLINLYDQVI